MVYRRIRPSDTDTTFPCEFYIVSAFFVHIREELFFSFREIEDTRPWLEKCFSISSNRAFFRYFSFWEIFFDLVEYRAIFGYIFRTFFEKSKCIEGEIDPERESTYHSHPNRAKFDQERFSPIAKYLSIVGLARIDEYIPPEIALPK
jgi:hypothetical protein